MHLFIGTLHQGLPMRMRLRKIRPLTVEVRPIGPCEAPRRRAQCRQNLEGVPCTGTHAPTAIRPAGRGR